ncbi:MAG: DUF2382 domain-containing protein [Bryobacteraceae bacterium]|nr:DUF2382 domain-containing protein [Bryobacteraceae bacterium]
MKENEQSIPLMEEQLEIRKRMVERGRTRVRKTVKRTPALVEERLARRSFDIRRVPVNQVVNEPAQPRYEGATLVLPIYEERLVVEKRLVLVEEVHVTPVNGEILERREVELLREEVEVLRSEGRDA